MFPVWFCEEMIDSLLLMTLKINVEFVVLLMCISINHLIRDSDVWYKYLYEKYIFKTLVAIKDLVKFYRNSSSIEEDDGNLSLEYITNLKNSTPRSIPEFQLQASSDRISVQIGTESEEVRIARIILQKDLLFFIEIIARFIVFLVLFIDFIGSQLQFGDNLLLQRLSEKRNLALILASIVSLIMPLITHLLVQMLIARRALLSIDLFRAKAMKHLSSRQKAFIHVWVFFGKDGKIWKQWWVFFVFVIIYQTIILLQSFVSLSGIQGICSFF